MRVAITRSRALGLPPRCTWPYDGDARIQTQFGADALGDFVGMANALGNDDQVMVFAAVLAFTDVLHDILFKIERMLGNQNGGSPDGDADIDGKMPGVAPP